MDLPITRPSMISYAEDCDFTEILNDLSSKKHNGFIRVTAGNDEGFILFKYGKEIAASYERSSRVDAINKIQAAMEDKSTLIEIFDVRDSQIDFLMDINQPYILGSEAYKIIDELKKANDVPEIEPQPKAVPKPKPVSEAIKESEKLEEPKVETGSNLVSASKLEEVNENNIEEKVNSIETVKSDLPTNSQTEDNSLKTAGTVSSKTVNKTVENSETVNLKGNETETIESDSDSESTMNTVNDNEFTQESSSTRSSSENVPLDSDTQLDKSETEEIENQEMPDMETEPLDRTELLKKYGIKDIQEEDVENILESYKGGSVSDEDIEKIELTLMNKIKKSILGIPKIRGAEVMVFLENSRELTGKVNIIIETESKGFLSRIMGDSNQMKLEKQIIDMSQIEIRKSFRKYPEIVDKFEVNVEIS